MNQPAVLDGPEPLAYSPAGAAAALSASKDWVYGLINSGQLRSIKVGGRRLIPRDALLELLEDA